MLAWRDNRLSANGDTTQARRILFIQGLTDHFALSYDGLNHLTKGGRSRLRELHPRPRLQLGRECGSGHIWSLATLSPSSSLGVRRISPLNQGLTASCQQGQHEWVRPRQVSHRSPIVLVGMRSNCRNWMHY